VVGVRPLMDFNSRLVRFGELIKIKFSMKILAIASKFTRLEK